MDPTRNSSSLARRAHPFRRGAPLVTAAAAALALTTGCTGGTQKTTAPGQPPADHSSTVDHGGDGSVSVDGGSVHVSGDAGSVSVQRNPDGSVTVTRPGAPPTTIPAGPGQGLSVTVDPSNASSRSVSVNVGGDQSSVSVTH